MKNQSYLTFLYLLINKIFSKVSIFLSLYLFFNRSCIHITCESCFSVTSFFRYQSITYFVCPFLAFALSVYFNFNFFFFLKDNLNVALFDFHRMKDSLSRLRNIFFCIFVSVRKSESMSIFSFILSISLSE